MPTDVNYSRGAVIYYECTAQEDYNPAAVLIMKASYM